MKKINYIIGPSFLIIGILIGFLIGQLIYKRDKVVEEPIFLEKDPIIKEYLDLEKQKIYLYNINEVKMKFENKEISLADFFKENKNDVEKTFAALTPYLEVTKVLKDGGTTIYTTKQNNNLFLQDLTIIKCQTEDGNKDIYFGQYLNTVTAFDMGACGKDFFMDVNFERVYTITNIELKEKYENEQETKYKLELTVEDNEGNKATITRIVDEESKNILKENKTYTFYFENKYGELIKEDISYIFANCTLTGVVPLEG